MIDRLERVKAHPFYVKWHFELGIAILFVGLALVLLVALIALNGGSEAGRQAHRALCNQRQATVLQLSENRRYLKLSPAERQAQFGIVVSDDFVRTRIAAELATLRSYSDLHC